MSMRMNSDPHKICGRSSVAQPLGFLFLSHPFTQGGDGDDACPKQVDVKSDSGNLRNRQIYP